MERKHRKGSSMGIGDFVELGGGRLLKMLDDFPAWKEAKERAILNKLSQEAVFKELLISRN